MDNKNLTWSEVVKLYKKLPISEQEAVVNFFNLHNAAIWIYNFLTDEAKSYVDESIKYSKVMEENSNALANAVFSEEKNGE